MMSLRCLALLTGLAALAVIPAAGQPAVPAAPAPPETLTVAPGSGDLAAAAARLVAAESGGVIRLLPGDHHLRPRPYRDPTCGNCTDPDQSIAATVGLCISGSSISIEGCDPDSVRIHTHAGYGLLFTGCRDCRLRGVTITSGVRDTAERATDAAIVVRQSHVTIEGCIIRDNLGDSATVAATVVGIIGVCGREGSDIELRDTEIRRNSWDGIALYRDARATIENCTIDGVDYGRGGPARGGRGVGIGITWNAEALIAGTLVRRYWKGIGIFVDARARVRECVVEDVLTWGIALWDAGDGKPYGDIAWNVVDGCGACGIAITRARVGEPSGSRIVQNAIRRTGRDPRYDGADAYCHQRALALQATTPDMVIADNLMSANREPGDAPGRSDVDPAAFRGALGPWLARLRTHPATRASGFVRAFDDSAAASQTSTPRR